MELIGLFRKWWHREPPKPFTMADLLQLPYWQQERYIKSVRGWAGWALGGWTKTVGDYELYISEVMGHGDCCQCCGHCRITTPSFYWHACIPGEPWEVYTVIGEGWDDALVMAAVRAELALSKYLGEQEG